MNLRKFYWVMYDVSCGAILERKNASVLTGSHFSQPSKDMGSNQRPATRDTRREDPEREGELRELSQQPFGADLSLA